MIRINRWLDLNSADLSRIAARDPVALLPTAAVEQHGPHLPLSTDITIGEGILQAAVSDLTERGDGGDCLILPGLRFGNSLEHTGFPGTLSLTVEQMIGSICAVGNGLSRAGIRRLVLFNSHGGNKAAIDAAALRLRAAHGFLAVKVHSFRFAVPPDTIDPEELMHGVHGGALETSMMLHLAPGKVQLAELANHESIGAVRAGAGLKLGPGGAASFAWMAGDLHPAGVAGNAEAASAELGARLVASFGKQLADIVLEAASFDLALFDRGS